jgi:hypothetical protein
MNILFILVIFFYASSFATKTQITPFIDPTGTYILKGIVKNNKIISSYGETRVKLLDSERLAICFYVTKDYPRNESASFVDTLLYFDNKATYKPQSDEGCTIVFSFGFKQLEITQTYSDVHGCSFARGILTATTFEKSSSDKPLIQDLSAHRPQ